MDVKFEIIDYVAKVVGLRFARSLHDVEDLREHFFAHCFHGKPSPATTRLHMLLVIRDNTRADEDQSCDFVYSVSGLKHGKASLDPMAHVILAEYNRAFNEWKEYYNQVDSANQQSGINTDF